MTLTAAQLTTLKTELQTDPSALGYAPLLAVSDWINLAAVLNFRRDGVTLCPVNGIVGSALSAFRNDVGVHDIINCIASSDFGAMTQLQIAKLSLLFTGTTTIDATVANTRTIVINIFSGASAGTLNALSAVSSRAGSRAEVLSGFPTGIVLTQQDVQAAIVGHY